MNKVTVITKDDTIIYDDISQISDGYHTFDELYKHRILLFIALMQAHDAVSWWSKKHADGSSYGGWIVAGMYISTGSISYHMPESYAQYLSNILEMEKAPAWDGHTPDDVLKRLELWLRTS